jgi:hypothetical protein
VAISLPSLTRTDTTGKPPKDVQDRIKRGREAMLKGAGARREAYKFFRGDQWCWVNETGQLSFLPTITYVTKAGGKPPHRQRRTRNFMRRLIEAKISAATNAMPGYDIAPTSTDPEAASAASVAKKVAVYGYDRWGLRKARVKLVTNALVADGGFIMPYFDPDVGPYVQTDQGTVGYGEIRMLVLNGNQVCWEPGCDFDDSPWWAIIRARPISEIEAMPGYTGGKLKADASTSDVPTDRPSEGMALVTEYFERPSLKEPQGRKLTLANDREIVPAGGYPLMDAQGRVCDEPLLHPLVYTVDPDSDRDLGLGSQMIEASRDLNNAVSKTQEWINRALNPQLAATKGSIDVKDRPNDEPGRIVWVKPGFQPPAWQQTPQIPPELRQEAQDAMDFMRAVAGDPDLANAAPTAAASSLQAIAQQAAQTWTAFLTALAETDSRVMRHALWLVQRYYTEPRLLELNGHMGWANVEDFRGTQIAGQCSVRVDASSLENRTRDQIKQDIQFWQTIYPGAVPPEAAMAAYYGGISENMMLDFRHDVARANEIVKAIRQGPQALLGRPMQQQMLPNPNAGQPDPVTGAPQAAMTVQDVPWWMPTAADNVRVWKQVLATFTKTAEFQMLDPGMKAATFNIYDALLNNEMQQAARQQAMQTQMAQQLGSANAAAPQGKALPSLPGVGGPPPAPQTINGNGT